MIENEDDKCCDDKCDGDISTNGDFSTNITTTTTSDWGLASTNDIPESSNKPRDIQIKPLDYGYIVTVGCQKFAIENSKKLVNTLKEYLDNPNKTEEKWFNGKLF